MSPASRSRARVALAIAGGYAGVIVGLYWPVFAGKRMLGWDCTVEYWPDLVFQIDSIQHGSWPLWNPFSLGGYPFWCDPQTGLYHPVTWLCWLGAAIAGTGAWLIQAKVFLNMLAGLCGMHVWTFARTRSHVAGAVAAITFVVGSPLLVYKDGSLLWPALYWPWVLLAIDQLYALPNTRRAAAVAGALWLCGTAGHPQSFFFGLIVFAIYVIYRATERPRRDLPSWRAWTIVVGLAALLLAATWIPAWVAIDVSGRGNRTLDYALQQPLPGSSLRELFTPNLDSNWIQDIYVGPVMLVGCVWLIAAGERRRRDWGLLWLVIATFAIALAVGRTGPILPWLAEHAPGFDLFRIAYRYKLIIGLVAAALSGEAVAGLIAASHSRRSRWIWSGSLVLWPGICALVGPIDCVALVLALATLVVAATFTWLERVPERFCGITRRIAMLSFPAIVFADLWHAGSGTLAILQRPPEPASDLERARVMDGVDGPWRYHVGDMSSPYGGTVPYHVAYLGKLREESGYVNPIEPARHVELELRAKHEPTLLANLNVRYFAGHHDLGARRDLAPGIAEIADAAPIARWYPCIEVLERDRVLDALMTKPPSTRTCAYAEARDVEGLELPAGTATPIAGRLVEYRADRVIVEIDAPAPGVLVLAEAYADGWTANIDQTPARVFRIDYHLRGTLVRAGHSRVVFDYAPRGWIVLPALFVLGLVSLGGLLIARSRST